MFGELSRSYILGQCGFGSVGKLRRREEVRELEGGKKERSDLQTPGNKKRELKIKGAMQRCLVRIFSAALLC